MPLTSREIVQQSLAFASPPRIPYAMGSGFPSDFRGVGRKRAPNRQMQPWTERAGYWNMIDEWGNEWRRLEDITKGEVYKGAIEEGWELLETYQWPDVDRADLYEDAAVRVEEFHREGYYVQGGVGMSFDIARYMRRMEIFLADCAAEPDRVQALLDPIADLLERQVHRFADIGVDGISSGEDWGTQDRQLMNPAMFRRLFKPVYTRVVGAAKSRGHCRFRMLPFLRRTMRYADSFAVPGWKATRECCHRLTTMRTPAPWYGCSAKATTTFGSTRRHGIVW